KVPEKMCPTCDGEGRVLSSGDVMVDIPGGIADGQTIRLRGYGEAGRRSASSGDLYVRINVQTDARFVREGDDIHTSVSMSVLQAILGDDISVDTVHGSIAWRIPAGTQPAQVFRLKGKGMPSVKGHGHGDREIVSREIVSREIDLPTHDLTTHHSSRLHL
ncbi:MAG: molecular chaperone DnaJ, partial [Candidatus Peregrinibacteria bacterium Greene0416_62]